MKTVQEPVCRTIWVLMFVAFATASYSTLTLAGPGPNPGPVTKQQVTEGSVFLLFKTRDSATVKFSTRWRICEPAGQSYWLEKRVHMATKEALRSASSSAESAKELFGDSSDLIDKAKEHIGAKVRPYGVCVESMKLLQEREVNNRIGET